MKKNSQSTFGLADPKREGGKFWPNDYLLFSGNLPPKSYYTKNELKEQKLKGYKDNSYA